MVWIGCVLLLAAILAAVWTGRRSLVVVTVYGESMVPTYRPGDRVLVRRRRGDRIRRDQIVVVSNPDPEQGWRPDGPAASQVGLAGPWLIKRATAVAGDPVPSSVAARVGPAVTTVPAGSLVVIGDGVRSGDSRMWGFVPAHQVLGVVIAALGGRGQ